MSPISTSRPKSRSASISALLDGEQTSHEMLDLVEIHPKRDMDQHFILR